MKNLLSSLVFIFALAVVQAQVVPPQAFNYSAVARNSEGIPLADTNLGIQISIRQSTPQGNVVYQENHQVETDAFGLFNLSVGAGAIVTGTMQGVQWGADDHYLEVGMDVNGGTSFQVMGITQLLSVPYALFAGSAGQIGSSGASFPVPTIHTDAVTEINSNGATFAGSIEGVQSSEIIELGFVYSTEPNASIGNSKTEVPIAIGAFSNTLGIFPISLTPLHYVFLITGTEYYVKAYAKTLNNLVFYGNEVNFSTLPTGQTGEGSGIVFYDKGYLSDGWRYLEVTPDDGIDSQWGCTNINLGAINNGVGIGAGDVNTSAVVNMCDDPNFAAKSVSDLVFGGKDDWYLPTIAEFRLMSRNLNMLGLGSFDESSESGYWSSVAINFGSAFYFRFNGGFGSYTSSSRLDVKHVRAVRAY